MFNKIGFYEVLMLVGFIAVLGFGCHPVTAASAPPTEQDIQQAKQQWIDEHGDAQPNLTAEQERYLFTEIKRMQGAQ